MGTDMSSITYKDLVSNGCSSLEREAQKLRFIKLPKLPSNMDEWFSWRMEAESTINVSGAGKILVSEVFDRQNPDASRMVKAMLEQAIAQTDGWELAQFVEPEKEEDKKSGFAVWNRLLNLFKTGPVINHHLEVTHKKIIDLECGEGLENYMDFVKEFLALRSLYTHVRNTAIEKEMECAEQYPAVVWKQRFTDKARKSFSCSLTASHCAKDETLTLMDTIQHIYFQLKEKHSVHEKQNKKKKHKGGLIKDHDMEKPKQDANADRSKLLSQLKGQDKGDDEEYSKALDLVMQKFGNKKRKGKNRNFKGKKQKTEHRRVAETPKVDFAIASMFDD